ncbi:MAG: HAD hydrolase-like protein, partial [Planctomycetota bacterium]|nr:HAD hydrolase-like protein [Planctomycetota bacterium]
TTPALDRAFGASIPHWPAFADSTRALAALKERYKLVILSNVSRAGIDASIGRLGVAFDAVYTAEAIGSYKPDPANFRYLLEHVQADFGVAPGGLLHVAQSLFHDHVPARALGLANAWIDRQGLADGGGFGATTPVEAMPAIDHRFESLEAFARAALA